MIHFYSYQERKTLESVSAEKEKLSSEKQALLESKKKLQALIASLGTLDTQRSLLQNKQDAYRKADAASSHMRQLYEALNKAFLDEPGLIGVHPNDNSATVWLKTEDLVDLIKEHGNEMDWIEV